MMTTVRILRPKEMKPGCCAICGRPAILKWHDLEIGQLGDCCYGPAVLADRSLQAAKLARPKGPGREQ